MLKKGLIAAALAGLLAAPALANGSASLQFTVAAPDPVMAGEEILLQTLVVNSGSAQWDRGTYYWVAEIYELDGDNRKFVAQTEPLSPLENVPKGGAHGVQIPYLVPEQFSGRRMLYRAVLIVNGKRLLETDYKGFQVIQREFKPPPEEQVKVGGDVTLTYKNNSEDSWTDHQLITAANLVGKVKKSSFIFNTYLVHTYHRPITANLIFLNYYAPWGVLSLGDVYPTLSPLSMDGQAVRGVQFERARGSTAFTAVAGRIVAPEEPTASLAGRLARYSGGFKYSGQVTPALKLTADAVVSRDDEFSITRDTASATLLAPQQSFVFGGMAEWKAGGGFVLTTDIQNSSYKPDLNDPDSRGGLAWKQEVKWRGRAASGRAAYSRVDAEYKSFSSPSVVPDRATFEADASLPAASWATVTASYSSYDDNLDKDPAKTTTHNTQASLSNTLRLSGGTMVTVTGMLNTALGKPATVQDNRTTTLSLSVMQPLGQDMLNATLQKSAFKDNTGFSSDLDTTLVSLNGSFKLSRRVSASAGAVRSETKNLAESSSLVNNTINGNIGYAVPGRALALQLWTSLSTGKNDSALTPSDTGTLTVNLEAMWLKSRSSKLTFGVGAVSKTDKYAPANEGAVLNLLTRYNYSF
jgi:hypothetical protein